MDKRFASKVSAFLLAACYAASAASAKEEFTKYSDVYKPGVPKNAAQAAPSPEGGPGSISQEELRALKEEKGLILFDARAKTDFERERIAGASLPHGADYYRDMELFRQKIVRAAPDSKASLRASTEALPRDSVIVTYCNKHCGLSKSLKMQLEDLGFTNVRWLAGGIDTWREKGYPLESGNS
jgi:rhodanese-related sulfurtransferase